MPLATIPYFLCKPQHFHLWWPGWQPKDALRHVRVFLQLGIPGMLMVMLEYLSYDIVAVFVAYLPNSGVTLSVHSVLWNTANIAYQLYMAIAEATNVLVGNYIGSGQTHHAKLVSSIGLIMVSMIAIFVSITFAVAHATMPTLFVNNHDVIHLASTALL